MIQAGISGHKGNRNPCTTSKMIYLVLLSIICLECLTEAAILRTGNPLPWERAKQYLNSVRLSGVKQFLNHYNRVQGVETSQFLWGDELEYGVFKHTRKDAENGVTGKSSPRFDLALGRGAELRSELSQLEKTYKELSTGCGWQPEYGSWMIEAVPRGPYGGFVSDLLAVEKNMKLRRMRLHSVLNPDEVAPTMSNFPMLGCRGYGHANPPNGPVSNSQYISDEVINPHPRFGALTRNIRMRKQGNVQIFVPADKDEIVKNANDDEDDKDEEEEGGGGGGVQVDEDEDFIHMDAMAFGMGCCCLQVTMQCQSEQESRFLHDQLAILAPLFLALSASTPIFKGRLADTDTRWDVISQAVDDRRDAELGYLSTRPPSIFGQQQQQQQQHDDNDHDKQQKKGKQHKGAIAKASQESLITAAPDPMLVGQGVRRLSKSRYSSVGRFIVKPSNEAESTTLDYLNDGSAELDEEAFSILMEGGVDSSLAAHLAHLFTRDPLVIFDDAIYLEDDTTVDHFENIQSTNWRSIRWKAPALEVGFEAKKRTEKMLEAQEEERKKQLEKFMSGNMDSGSSSSSSSSSSSDEEIVETSNLSEDSDSEIPLDTVGPGWRVELRTLELQLTDFENAALALLSVLATRSMLAMGYNFYMPMSLVEENMSRAQKKDACRSQKFWVRKQAFQGEPPLCIPDLDASDYVEMSLDEFMNGSKTSLQSQSSIADVGTNNNVDEDEETCDDMGMGDVAAAEPFPGLIPAIFSYLEALGCNSVIMRKLEPYFALLSQRASGELPTTASWIRKFVTSHPSYRGDGRVPPEAADALISICDDIGMGRVVRRDLTGNANIERLCKDDASVAYLSASLSTDARSKHSSPSTSSSTSTSTSSSSRKSSPVTASSKSSSSTHETSPLASGEGGKPCNCEGSQVINTCCESWVGIPATIHNKRLKQDKYLDTFLQ